MQSCIKIKLTLIKILLDIAVSPLWRQRFMIKDQIKQNGIPDLVTDDDIISFYQRLIVLASRGKLK